MKTGRILLLISVFLFNGFTSAWALDDATLKEIDRILHSKLSELTVEANALLDKEYPDEDWDAYNFPSFVYTNDAVETGYKIAVKKPQILKQTYCYCFCETMGHASLLSCFWKDGKVGGTFDDHGAGCNICVAEAMQVLLIYNLGATEEVVDKLLEKRFQKNIEKKKSYDEYMKKKQEEENKR